MCSFCCCFFFYFFSSGGHFVQQSGTIWAILVEGIMGNIPMKLCFKLGPVVQKEIEVI